MTCKGYDVKAVSVPKSVKRLAATIRDNHVRGAFIRDYVRLLENKSRTGNKKEE